ncbi:pyruvate dehydrogenase kinase, partial [Strigomonas culicis]
MFRKTFLRYLTVSDLTDRMDSFEREMIELKSFRNAVEIAAPNVAAEAKRATEARLKECKSNASHLDIPLTAGEFTVLNQFYAAQKLKPIPMENLMYISKPNDLLAHAIAVHREYLVRMAKRARQLSLAPYGLSQMPSILELKKYYQLSFHDFRSAATPKTTDDLIQFDNLVRRVFLRHYNVSTLLCEGMRELPQREQWATVNVHLRDAYPDLQVLFEKFCTERVKLRLLIGNYMYLSNQILKMDPSTYKTDDPHNQTTQLLFSHAPEHSVGQISKKTSLVTLLKDAIASLQPTYDDAEISLKIAGDPSLTFVGIPYIIHDIMSALLDDAIQSNLIRQELYGIPCSEIEVTL